MKLERLPYDPAALLDFYDEGLTALGALSERTWHDRLEVVAEGPAARLWNPEGALHGVELVFIPPDVRAAREASREVFPGCPLTFRLVEALRPAPLPLERIVLAGEPRSGPPDPAVIEKLWRVQFPQTLRWRLLAAVQPGFHFSLVALARCEIQAIDQHWSLHRLALALPGGEPDQALAQGFGFAQAQNPAEVEVAWPPVDPARWQGFLRTALEADLADELTAIRARQEQHLRRELERIDDYFQNYERELTARAVRTRSEGGKAKSADRLAAAKTEHARRRTDQVARYEIRIQPHWDALLLVAEPAWSASLEILSGHETRQLQARYVARARRWFA